MNKKTPKCSKGFPCGKTCISRTRLCWANLSTKDNIIMENYSQYLKRMEKVSPNLPQREKLLDTYREIEKRKLSLYNEKKKSKDKISISSVDYDKNEDILKGFESDLRGLGIPFNMFKDSTYSIYNEYVKIIGKFNSLDEFLEKYDDIEGGEAKRKLITIRESQPEIYKKINEYYEEKIFEEKRIQDKLDSEISKLDASLNDAFLSQFDNLETDYSRNNIPESFKERGLPVGSGTDSEKKVQSLINERTPMMVSTVSGLINAAKDGRFKTVFDSDSSNKIGIAAGSATDKAYEDYKKARREKEKTFLNLEEDTPADKRPVYGFLGNEKELTSEFNPEHTSALTDYGDIVIKFKNEIKDNSTVVLGDSFRPGVKASPVNKISEESFQTKDIDLNADSLYSLNPEERIRYLEWQSGNSLSISDVESLYIPYNIYESLSKDELDELQKMQIPIFLLPKKD